MAYVIPDRVLQEMKKLAESSGLPYATIVNQRLYDLQGLVGALQLELHDAQAALNRASSAGDLEAAKAHESEVARKLAEAQEEVSAYKHESAHGAA